MCPCIRSYSNIAQPMTTVMNWSPFDQFQLVSPDCTSSNMSGHKLFMTCHQPLTYPWCGTQFGSCFQISTALALRYRNAEETGKAHDIKGSGVMHPLSSEVIKSCLPNGQVKAFPANCLSLMTISGAKGSLVNFSQISCLLGQQVRVVR